jgi:F-type H+-transporting ATPase subunit O
MLAAVRASTVSAGLGRRAASTIALKYAHAAYGAALKASPATLTKVQTELNAIAKTLKEDPALHQFVTNPTLSLQDRLAGLPTLLGKVGDPKDPVSDVTKNLLAVLSENGRLAEAEGVIEGYNELVAKYQGELTVVVTSAAPLPKDVLTRLETTLKQSQTAQQAKSLKVTNKVRCARWVRCGIHSNLHPGKPFGARRPCRRLWREDGRPERCLAH